MIEASWLPGRVSLEKSRGKHEQLTLLSFHYYHPPKTTELEFIGIHEIASSDHSRARASRDAELTPLVDQASCAERNREHAFSRDSENAAIAARIIADDNAITTNICAKLRESGAVIYRRL